MPTARMKPHNSGMTQPAGLEAFDKTKRLIVVAAHPDDLETQLGGTIALLTQRGVTVFSVNATLGNIGTHDPAYTRHTLAVRRIEETKAAADILGITQTFALGRDDGELVADLALRAEIANLYRITQADTLITFDPHARTQIHPDHRAIGRAAMDAYMPSKMPLYRPEQLTNPEADLGCIKQVFVFGTDQTPDVLVDIDSVYDTKMASCIAHQSQFEKGAESLEWMNKRDAARAEAFAMQYAESFKQTMVW